MPELNPEQLSRQQIDEQLRACGWIVQDYKAIDFSAGRRIAVREVPLKTGPCDCLLLVDRKALGVVDAKKVGTTWSTDAGKPSQYSSGLPDLLRAKATGAIEFLYASEAVEANRHESHAGYTTDALPNERQVGNYVSPFSCTATRPHMLVAAIPNIMNPSRKEKRSSNAGLASEQTITQRCRTNLESKCFLRQFERSPRARTPFQIPRMWIVSCQ